MSQEICCVSGCLSVKKDGVTLHKFPNPGKHLDKFESWISKIGGEVAAMESMSVYYSRRVCRKHFEAIHLYPNNRLSQQAMPVLHIQAPLIKPNQPPTSDTGSQSPCSNSAALAELSRPSISGTLKQSVIVISGFHVNMKGSREFKALQKKLHKCEQEKLSFKRKYILAQRKCQKLLHLLKYHST